MSTLSTTLIWLAVAVLTVVGLYNLYQGREPRAPRRVADKGRAGAADAGATGQASPSRRGEPTVGAPSTGLNFEPQTTGADEMIEAVEPAARADFAGPSGRPSDLDAGAGAAQGPGPASAAQGPGPHTATKSQSPVQAAAVTPAAGVPAATRSPSGPPTSGGTSDGPMPWISATGTDSNAGTATGRPGAPAAHPPSDGARVDSSGAPRGPATAADPVVGAEASAAAGAPASLSPLSSFGPVTHSARAFEPSVIDVPTQAGGAGNAQGARAPAASSAVPSGAGPSVAGRSPATPVDAAARSAGKHASAATGPTGAGAGGAGPGGDGLGGDGLGGDGLGGSADGRIAPGVGANGSADQAAQIGAIPAGREALARARLATPLNPVCDSIVEIRLPSQYGADHLLGISQSLRRAGSKPVHFEGLLQERSGERWIPIASGQRPATFSRIRAGVLLANRHGPLNAMEFSDFTQNVATLAQQLTASYELPDMKDVLSRARAIDDACIELDAQVSLNVDVKEALGTEEIERFAREQSLVPLGGQRFARLGERRELLFTLGPVQPPNRLSFLLDVPNAPSTEEPWQRLVHCAKTAAVRLQGHLVDDDGRPLSDAALEQIGEQLHLRHQQLELAGFAAGSPLASRLFS